MSKGIKKKNKIKFWKKWEKNKQETKIKINDKNNKRNDLVKSKIRLNI